MFEAELFSCDRLRELYERIPCGIAGEPEVVPPDEIPRRLLPLAENAVRGKCERPVGSAGNNVLFENHERYAA